MEIWIYCFFTLSLYIVYFKKKFIPVLHSDGHSVGLCRCYKEQMMMNFPWCQIRLHEDSNDSGVAQWAQRCSR